MPSTTRGIYHNLKESKYRTFNNEVLFYFSSELYRDKFLEGYLKNRELMRNKSKAILNTERLNIDTLSDIIFYEEIEKRGFFVRLDRARITYDDLYKYALRKMGDKTSPEWVKQ
ncbi:MAG TPA: early protein GP4 [Rummeliibacillus sp.]|nr:early protein GP4 [Rummeliibacillus sp.]